MRIFGIISESFNMKRQFFFDLAIYCFNDRLLNWEFRYGYKVRCEFCFRKLYIKNYYEKKL